jgi:flagellar hook-associated protein 3 FlgL
MVTRIATYYQNQESLRSVQTANAGMALSTYQITSGNKNRTLADTANDSSQILNLTDVINRMGIYANNITSANNSLAASENALSGMSDLLSEAASVYTLGRNENSADTRASLVSKAQAILDTFTGFLNTQFNGTYIFSGMNGTQPPVTGPLTGQDYATASADTTWYNGDDTPPSVVTGPGTTLQYGVAGNSTAFQEIKAGLQALVYGLQNNSLTDIDSAVDSLTQGGSDLSVMQGTVGGQINSLSDLSDQQDSQKTFLQQQLNNLTKVDVSEALTTFSQQQATLQASLLIITQVNQISLLNYLK